MPQAPRCAVKIPLDLMADLRKIKTENHTTVIGAIALLINLYKKDKHNEN